jgi:hypothetical protein
MTMKLVKAMFGGLMLAAAPLAALADDMSYNFVDVAYVETDIDDAPTADGFALRGSVGFAENWFAFGEYSDQSVAGIDLTSYAAGVGGHYGIAENLDLVGRLGYFKVELDAGGGFDADDDGYLFDLGLRGRVGDAVELEGGARYTDLSDGGDDTSLFFGGRFHFNGTWALGAEIRSGDDADTILAYVRASF